MIAIGKLDVCEIGRNSPEPTIRNFRIVQIEGNRSVSRRVDHYWLEVVHQLAEDEYDKFQIRQLAEEAQHEIDTDVESLRKRIETDQDEQDDAAT